MIPTQEKTTAEKILLWIDVENVLLLKYLSLEEQLMTGKNIPSRLKLRKLPLIGIPLKVKDITGTVKSKAHPMTSSERRVHGLYNHIIV